MRAKGEIPPAHGVGKKDEMEAVAEESRHGGGEASVLAAKVLIYDEVKALFEHGRNLCRLDIMINNAGIEYLFGPLIEMTQERWDAVQER